MECTRGGVGSTSAAERRLVSSGDGIIFPLPACIVEAIRTKGLFPFIFSCDIIMPLALLAYSGAM